jgi:GNAT superfamily N-acetyltransferase
MDYDQSDIATTYDQARALTQARRRRWQRLLSAHLDHSALAIAVDLGCGTGRFSEMLAVELGARVIGLDPSAKMIEQARRKLATGSIAFGRAAAQSPCSNLVANLNTEIEIRPFADDDAPQVRELFIATNRLLSPPDLRDAFEAYIERGLAEEIDRIADYYREHDGRFWVVIQNDGLVGTFGLERAAPDAMELRRMYVDAAARRNGIGRRMLQYAEDECRRRNIARLELSTTEIQSAALALYKNAGYQLLREDIAEITGVRLSGCEWPIIA